MKAIKYFAVVTAILVVAILLKGEIQKSPVMAFIAGLCLMLVLIILPWSKGTDSEDARAAWPWGKDIARFYNRTMYVTFLAMVVCAILGWWYLAYMIVFVFLDAVLYLFVFRKRAIQEYRSGRMGTFSWWSFYGRRVPAFVNSIVILFEIGFIVMGMASDISKFGWPTFIKPAVAVVPAPSSVTSPSFSGLMVDQRDAVVKLAPSMKTKLGANEQPETTYDKGIVIHHTGAASCNPNETWEASISAHTDWVRSPYNILVGKDGTINLLTDVGIIAYSAGEENNPHYFAITLIGNFQAPCNMVPSDAQIVGVVKAIRYAISKGVPAQIVGHRDIGTTECPGDNVYPLIKDFLALAQRNDLGEDTQLIAAAQQLQDTYAKKLGWKTVPKTALASIPQNVTRLSPTSGTRAVWVDAYNSPPNSAQMATDLVAWAKKNGISLIVLQVRTRNTACYFKGCSNMTFDGLGAVLAAAQPAGIQVDAWYDGGWMSSDSSPDYTNAAEQTRILADIKAIVENYPNVHGVNLDRIRYSDGSNASATQRDALTELVGKMHAITSAAGKTLSASVVTWSPTPAKGGFKATRPFTEVGQDFETWAQKKYIDILMPMNYFESLSDYQAWVDYEAQLKQSTGVPFLSGLPDYFLNEGRNVDLTAMEKYAAQKGAGGVIYYSYASMVKGGRELGPTQEMGSQIQAPIIIPTPQGGWPTPTPQAQQPAPDLGQVIGGLWSQLTRQQPSATPQPSQSAPAQSPAGSSQFNGQNAMATDKHLANDIGVRKCGSAKEDQTFDWLKAQLESYGYQPQLITVNYKDVEPYVPAGTTRQQAEQAMFAPAAENWPNGRTHVLLAGNLTNPVFALGAHVDSLGEGNLDGEKTGGPGANDNGSGTSVLLELARIKASSNTAYMFFGCEEAGLFGSEYVAAKGLVKPSVGMLSVDMVGVKGTDNTLLFFGAAQDRQLIDYAVNAAKAQGRQAVSEDEGSAVGGSDDTSFRQHGITAGSVCWGKKGSFGVQSLWMITFADSPDMHRPSDTPDKVELAALQDLGDYLAIMIAGGGQTPTQPLAQQPQVPNVDFGQLVGNLWSQLTGQTPATPAPQQPLPTAQPQPTPPNSGSVSNQGVNVVYWNSPSDWVPDPTKVAAGFTKVGAKVPNGFKICVLGRGYETYQFADSEAYMPGAPGLTSMNAQQRSGTGGCWVVLWPYEAPRNVNEPNMIEVLSHELSKHVVLGRFDDNIVGIADGQQFVDFCVALGGEQSWCQKRNSAILGGTKVPLPALPPVPQVSSQQSQAQPQQQQRSAPAPAPTQAPRVQAPSQQPQQPAPTRRIDPTPMPVSTLPAVQAIKEGDRCDSNRDLYSPDASFLCSLSCGQENGLDYAIWRKPDGGPCPRVS